MNSAREGNTTESVRVPANKLIDTEKCIEGEVEVACGTSWKKDPPLQDIVWTWNYMCHTATPPKPRDAVSQGKAQAAILDGLRWRFQVQNRIFLAYISLCGRGLCSMSALKSEINYRPSPGNDDANVQCELHTIRPGRFRTL